MTCRPHTVTSSLLTCFKIHRISVHECKLEEAASDVATEAD
jgi:hypothetical protein